MLAASLGRTSSPEGQLRPRSPRRSHRTPTAVKINYICNCILADHCLPLPPSLLLYLHIVNITALVYCIKVLPFHWLWVNSLLYGTPEEKKIEVKTNKKQMYFCEIPQNFYFSAHSPARTLTSPAGWRHHPRWVLRSQGHCHTAEVYTARLGLWEAWTINLSEPHARFPGIKNRNINSRLMQCKFKLIKTVYHLANNWISIICVIRGVWLIRWKKHPKVIRPVFSFFLSE